MTDKKTPNPSLPVHAPGPTRRLVTTDTPSERPSQPSPGDVLADRWHQTGVVRIVEVEWLDAISTGDEWVGDQDLDIDPAPSLAIGYLVADLPEAVTLVALVNGEWWANGITIPRGCIVQIRYLASPR
jgi:hypothetical protein